MFYLSKAQSQHVKIVIDAGHGGNDPGHLAAYKNQLPEKDINMKIAQFISNYIDKHLQHIEVIQTRKSDQHVSLGKRVQLANDKQADYFISIHCNGSENKQVFGTETHIHESELSKSNRLAKAIENQFDKRAARDSRGIKESDDRKHSLQVLKYTTMPSVLVECGFLSNFKEATFLNTTYGQEIIASAIFRGLRSFLQKQYPNTNFVKPENTLEYAIQFMSSKHPIKTDSPLFDKLPKPIIEIELNTQNPYKFIYLAGNYITKKEATKQLSLIKKTGYQDAFITTRE